LLITSNLHLPVNGSQAPQSPGTTPEVKAKDHHAKIITLSEVVPSTVPWFWEPYLVQGMVSMLSGDPGTGKTFIAQSIAAALSVGQVPYTQESRPPGSVLYLSLENSPEYILRPRFDKLGGDPSRFHLINGSVKLSDVPCLSNAIKETGAQLMVVDPIQSFLGADVDAHRANETRPLMDNLSRLATEYKCCILLLRHLSKAPASRAIYRGMGSIDFTGAVRTELLAGYSSSDPGLRALVHTKSNIGPIGNSLGYSTANGSFSWTGESDLTAQDLLSRESSKEEGDAIAEAKEFLASKLSEKACMVNELYAESEQLGISKVTLKRAKKQLKIEAQKIGLTGGWEWSLPKQIKSP